MNDIPLHNYRFQQENFGVNLKLVEKVEELARAKGCISTQLALSWIRACTGTSGWSVIISIPGAGP